MMTADDLILKVRKALDAVKDRQTGRGLVAAGRVTGLSASPSGVVRFTLEGPGPAEEAARLAAAAETAAASVEGVSRVVAVTTAHRPPPAAGGHDDALGLGRRPRPDLATSLPGVRHVVAVASGKGGVGKSTVTANLAASLARRGRAVGLLDADIYGPSQPMLLGLSGRPDVSSGKIAPMTAHGVKAMSIGLLVDPDKALAWRGPMVMGAVRQLMTDVDWGPLDILFIDTPPGTGDAHLTLAQSRRMTAAVIVSTPQALALADVRRGVSLFRTVGAPILGVVENMAWLEMEDGERRYLFGQGGAERAARELGAPFLGALPLFPDLREASDAGAPPAAAAPGSAAAVAFDALADRIEAALAAY